MGLEEVRQEIVEEAEREAEKLLEEAEEEKEEILEEAKEEKKEVLKKAEEEAEKEAEAIRKKEISNARMEAQEKRLEAREEIIEEVKEKFRDRIEGLDQETERELVEESLEDLSQEIDIGVVRTREEIQDLAEGYGEFKEMDERGAVVKTADGSRRFDLTFDSIAENTVNESRKEVSEVLFD